MYNDEKRNSLEASTANEFSIERQLEYSDTRNSKRMTKCVEVYLLSTEILMTVQKSRKHILLDICKSLC